MCTNQNTLLIDKVVGEGTCRLRMRDGGGRKTRGKACELVGQMVDTGATRLIWGIPESIRQHLYQPPDQ